MEKILTLETMKLLFLTSKPVFPSLDGGCYASEKFLNCLLHAGVEVKHVTLSTPKHPFNESAYPAEIIRATQPINFFVDTNVHPLTAFLHLFKSGSYNCDRFYSASVESALIDLVQAEHVDGIILDSLYTTPYLEALRSIFKGKIVLRTHNVEHKLWEQYSADASGLKSRYFQRLARDLKQFEIKQLNAVDEILSISKDDSECFTSLGIRTKITDIPVAIAVNKNTVRSEGSSLYYIGAMDWKPNQQAVAELITWMPRLRESLPNLELHIAGSKSDELLSSDKTNGIFVHGYVKSMEDFATEHGILVSPIRSASGVRIKFLEAMAAGIPIVTTKLGALGIDQSESDCMCIAETEAEFTQYITALVLDPTKRKEIGANAKDYIRKNHTIDTISQAIVNVFGGNT